MSDRSALDEETLRLQQLAALGELAAGVTHESRNLLTAIVGFAQLARQRPDDLEAGRRHLESIEREALRCVEILDRFLTFARANDGDPEIVDLGSLVTQVVNATSHQALMGRVALRPDVAPDLPPVRTRRGEVMQVVLNLLINALHATPPGGTIEITAARGPRGIEIVVTDTGPGVAVEVRPRIFQAFFTTKAAGKGTGLGLAMCRRILDALGGTIELDESYEQGARFVVQLPLEPSR